MGAADWLDWGAKMYDTYEQYKDKERQLTPRPEPWTQLDEDVKNRMLTFTDPSLSTRAALTGTAMNAINDYNNPETGISWKSMPSIKSFSEMPSGFVAYGGTKRSPFEMPPPASAAGVTPGRGAGGEQPGGNKDAGSEVNKIKADEFGGPGGQPTGAFGNPVDNVGGNTFDFMDDLPAPDKWTEEDKAQIIEAVKGLGPVVQGAVKSFFSGNPLPAAVAIIKALWKGMKGQGQGDPNAKAVEVNQALIRDGLSSQNGVNPGSILFIGNEFYERDQAGQLQPVTGAKKFSLMRTYFPERFNSGFAGGGGAPGQNYQQDQARTIDRMTSY